jgi:hypothetical protein
MKTLYKIIPRDQMSAGKECLKKGEIKKSQEIA